MSDQQQVTSKRWILAIVAAVLSAFVIGGVFALIANTDGGTNAGAGATSTSTTPTSTTTRSTTTTPPPPPEVAFTCSLDGSSTNQQSFFMDIGGDFAPIWAVAPRSCEATRDPVALLPFEQQAASASGYPAGTSIATLYELCARVDPNNTYIGPEFILSAEQIAEVTGMLTLCPAHPQAAQLHDAVARAQAEAAATAAGELFYAGTFLVNVEIKPGTYAVEGDITNCYWERTDASGEIIDNNFITGARRVQVTIRASDYSFHNEGCGKWRKVA
jgi:hypothetical protein